MIIIVVIKNKFFSWTEDNRMQGFYNETQKIAALYRYDASGERELKLTAKVQDIWTQNMGYQKQPIFDNATLYASPLVTINVTNLKGFNKAGNYVKHYFAGTERILANVAGRGQAMIGVDEPLKPIAKNTTPEELAKEYYTFVSSYFNKKANENACVDNGILFDAVIDLPSARTMYNKLLNSALPDKLYYFNANHLGSGSLITDDVGATYQTLAYAPHGEILVNDFAGTYDEPYKFTGYERDQESGLDYAHARYYWSNGGYDISTDPHWFNYPHITPYNYAGNNPINRIDPTGMKWKTTSDEEFAYKLTTAMNDKVKSDQKSLDRLNKTIAKNEADGKDVSAEKAEAASMRAGIDILKAGVNEIAKMGDKNNEQVFTYVMVDGNIGETEKGNDGVITMKIAGNGSIINGIHESSHGYDLSQGRDTQKNFFEREIKAYSRQFVYGGSSAMPASDWYKPVQGLQDITKSYILGITDNKGDYIYAKRYYGTSYDYKAMRNVFKMARKEKW